MSSDISPSHMHQFEDNLSASDSGNSQAPQEIDTAPVKEVDSLLNLDVFDPATLESFRKMAGEDAVFLITDLLSTYLEDAPERLHKMQQAVDETNPQALCDAAHALKSASANLGATQLSRLCAKAEVLGRDGEMTGAPEIVSSITQAYKTIQSIFEMEIAQMS